MFLALSSQSDKPIYEQIATQIKQQIASGKLAPHEALPSI
ncbi:MAG: GntR family transcriptional regulator, partial [Oscillospiraceae bacterium]|nr:GntR family transcriptional regulator [Oscillospiraceae bacterium]